MRLAVIHWFPLEQYPPVMNLLTVLGDSPDLDVYAYTTRTERSLQAYAHANIRIKRTQFPSTSKPWLYRLYCFLAYPLLSFLSLLWIRPQVLIYFEPHSAFAAWIYCALDWRCRLFVHYHEYHRPEEYQQRGMRLVSWYHDLECNSLYERAEWISQTNPDRIRLFSNDHPRIKRDKLRAMANRPPATWFSGNPVGWPENPCESIRLIYVGALSLHDTFIEPLIDWLTAYKGRSMSLDIYGYNIDAKTNQYLNELPYPSIRFFDQGVNYAELPEILRTYHVGLILYRGNTPNYVYNAPNKLFEYLACGLDVWYPKQMLGVKPYQNIATRPRVVELDFENLTGNPPPLDYLDASVPYNQISCEKELVPLLTAIRTAAEKVD